MMLIVIFAFGILFQAEACKILWNDTDSSDGPSPVNALRVETEETTSYTSYPQLEDDPMLNITSNLHPDVPNSSYDVIFALLTETNATNFPKTYNSSIYETDTENPFSKCPDIGGPQVTGSVVMCYCKGNEIYVNGKCQVYDGAIVIPVGDWIKTKEENVINYNVTVQDVICDTSKYSYINFTRHQFHLRTYEWDVVLEEAGKLEGQRINNYCIFHHLDEYDHLTWTMKACVPIPSVPRCCPPGQAMKEGKCQDANTPDVLKPPISTDLSFDFINLGNITDYYSPVKCDSDYEHLITIALGHSQSHLVSLANGVEYSWVPGDTDKSREYKKCPEYCVDGINNSEGSVEYFISFCYSDPKEIHKKLCANGTCLRKCCKHGYSMDKHHQTCVPDPNSTFIPPNEENLSNYTIVIGFPVCTHGLKVEENITIDANGSLMLKDRNFTSTDFCVDTFLDNEHQHQSAVACQPETSLWSKVRTYLLPICFVISLIFLMITIVCHLLVPRILKNGGLHQLCYMIALFIAYAINLPVKMFRGRLGSEDCIYLGIGIQFGFLAAFFWLNVMCFEIWRKIRSLKSYRPCKSYPNKYYMMYGWGIPFLISVFTLLMQIHATEVVRGVIKPAMGLPKCWFQEDIDLLIYFYGPIAVLFLFNSVFLVLTYINYKVLLRNYKETANDLKELGAGVIREQHIKPSCIPWRQVFDHVHDFNQKLKIFILVATCWVTEILSWKIPPPELWALTDTLNSLQGFFLFIILLSNSNKRKHLKKKFLRLFLWLEKSNTFPTNMKKWLQNSVNRTILPTSSLTSSISSQFSNSSVFRTITTSVRSSNPPSSSSSFYVQSSLPGSDSIQAPADPSLPSFKSPEVTPDSSF